MNERLRIVRAHTGMNQSEFARALGIGQSTLAMMETGKREIHERHIKTICAIFDVNEHWLRTGEGDPFPETTDNIVQFAAAHPDMSDVDKALMEAYFDLSDEQKDVFLQYCLKVAEAWNNKNNRKSTAAARSGDRAEVAQVSKEEEDAVLPPEYTGDI